MHAYKIFFIALTTLFSLSANAETTLTVTHPEIPAPTLLDHGQSGESVGDVRIWRFPAATAKGELVNTDWIMTTTGVVDSKEIQYRMTSATLSFGKGTADQLSFKVLLNMRARRLPYKTQPQPPAPSLAGLEGSPMQRAGWKQSIYPMEPGATCFT